MRKPTMPRDLAKAAGSLAKLPSNVLRGRESVTDADRDRAEERLHEALIESRITVTELEERLDAVYAAVVVADLREPLAGLPGDDIGGSAADGRRADAKGLVLRAGASGITRDGDWEVPARLQVRSGMGSVELDFCGTRIEHRVVTVELKLGRGSATLVLPDDATANVDGLIASTGSIKSNVPSKANDRAPHFVVLGRTRLGSVVVRRRRGFAGLRF